METGNDPRRRGRANIADLVDLYLDPRGLPGRAGRRPARARSTRSRDHRPRLVVLDIGLPDIDGLEVCRRIRRPSNIPVIFLTARGDEVDRVARPRARRRRLPHQAVLPRRARRAGEGGAAPGRRRPAGRDRAGRAASTIDVGRREIRVDDAVGRVHHQGVRPAAVPRRTARARARAASRSSTACGATTGSATCAPSTCTSRRCARSSATRARSRRCAASATASIARPST